VLRQIAVDPISLRNDGTIAKVMPGHGGPVANFTPRRTRGLPWRASGDTITALNAPAKAVDDNYATLWRAPATGGATLVADLGRRQRVTRSLVRPEFAARPYRFAVEASDDGRRWRPVAAAATRSGSPIAIDHRVTARYLRLRTQEPGTGVWEWTILP
jgi:hypothetical protein